METKVQATLRVATWNVGATNSADRKQLPCEQPVDLLCAQEVDATDFEDLLDAGGFDWGVWSLHHGLRLDGSSDSQRLGVAVFGRAPHRLRASTVLEQLPQPEKFLVASVDLDGWESPVNVASYHAPPRSVKGPMTLAVAHYFELRPEPSILGLDANSPDVDHPDHEQSVFHWRQAPWEHCEPALIGPPSARRHRMEDAFRVWLDAHPKKLEAIRAERPDGPLAVTYDRHKTHEGFSPSRYDSIWVSPEFDVSGIDHLWDDDAGPEGGAPLGGGDHAMVVVELTPRPTPDQRRSGEDLIDHIIRVRLVEEGAALRFNPEPLPHDEQRAVEQHLERNPGVARATFVRDRNRPLEWHGERRKLLDLARRIAEEAGVTLPGRPAGPHWWIIESTNQTLAEISGDAGWLQRHPPSPSGST